MFASLRSRIASLAGLLSGAVLLLGAALLNTDYRSRDAFAWVNHTQEVIISIDGIVGDLREAESGLRGYLLTNSESYLEPFDKDLAEAKSLSAHLRKLVSDNPEQERRAAALDSLVHAKSGAMASAVTAARTHGGERAIDPQARARGKAIMDRLTQLATKMRAEERHLLAVRTAAAESRAERTRFLLIIGWPALALLITLAAFVILRSVGRPLSDLLDVVERFGSGDREARVRVEGRPVEFRRLSEAYNDMAAKLGTAMGRQATAEQEVARANAELSRRGQALEARNRSIELIGEMVQRMQALRADSELAEVLECFLPKVLPDHAGSLYVVNNSRNLLVQCVAWGDPVMSPDSFAPDACWALRRGNAHSVEKPGADVFCAHAADAFPIERRCEPVLAGGDVLGLLYVEGALDDEQFFRLQLLLENIALALVNENLRKRLREQSIRDPLTGLFNRRYMEETLALETARAVRNRSPLAVIMADIDHFKRFNDSHGHEAGDALLTTVAATLQAHFRDGDIVCRYGGEEFTIIAPGADLDLIRRRAEALRHSISELTVDYRDRQLGPVTMSFGIDCWDANGGRRIEEMILEADRALFRAKRLGRNRIELAPPAPAQLAAE